MWYLDVYSTLRGARNGSRRLGIPRLVSIGRLALLFGLGGGFAERLLEVGDDVVDVLGADGDADEILFNISIGSICLKWLECKDLPP